MQKSADEAMAAVSVVITGARPVAVVGKMLEHQVEQLHCLCDLGLRHGLCAPDPGNGRTLSRTDHNPHRRALTPKQPGRSATDRCFAIAIKDPLYRIWRSSTPARISAKI